MRPRDIVGHNMLLQMPGILQILLLLFRKRRIVCWCKTALEEKSLEVLQVFCHVRHFYPPLSIAAMYPFFRRNRYSASILLNSTQSSPPPASFEGSDSAKCVRLRPARF